MISNTHTHTHTHALKSREVFPPLQRRVEQEAVTDEFIYFLEAPCSTQQLHVEITWGSIKLLFNHPGAEKNEACWGFQKTKTSRSGSESLTRGPVEFNK